MRILVISDSHGRRSTLCDVVQLAEKKDAPEVIIHLGDFALDAKYLRERVRQRVISVPGNCDWGITQQTERIERIEDVSIFLCHGHTYRVKQTLLPLACRAQEAGVQAALFGHTHAAFCGYEHGVLMLNPGALQDERCAVLTVQAGNVNAELLRLDDLC